VVWEAGDSNNTHTCLFRHRSPECDLRVRNLFVIVVSHSSSAFFATGGLRHIAFERYDLGQSDAVLRGKLPSVITPGTKPMPAEFHHQEFLISRSSAGNSVTECVPDCRFLKTKAYHSSCSVSSKSTDVLRLRTSCREVALFNIRSTASER
jgi:hypothetical protein